MKKLVYPAKYSDKNGSVDTEINNDGKELSILIRGVEFRDTDFDGFKPVEGTPSRELTTFSFDRSQHLIDYSLECDIPTLIGISGEEISCNLKMNLCLGKLLPNNRLEEETISLELICEKMVVKSSGKSGWFEDEMLEIQKKLKPGYFFKNCFGCLYSDYNVVGHGLFGNMICFRNIKKDYLAVKTKIEFIDIMEDMTEYVQETHLCPEFKKRIPGTGYRG